ncbi:NAD-dependent epimerase/dehydratase family protein [Amycolatopsis sp. 195334CR]|uniref:NAD-dependent epimerase/dehydratase family protein n=1 Tax=Amycolatopsis sp. 195334CR TaxID=2814588 RepID=UPI001A8DDC88|nr:NAD-dependent epimerase/dehydratase family protein [Amycolatopsis sp. 195334CR]MBN6038396.1 NAD-dependent epimerase/dehydratase family protein [Amycolatopsis sp. 195334CR]
MSHVIVTGATGNLGVAVLRALAGEPAVTSVTGLARRRPAWRPEGVEFAEIDVATEEPDFTGADAVVHLAWQFQPARHPERTWEANVLGSLRVFEAAARAGATLVHASSVGTYAPGPKDDRVAEDWPTHGWPGAAYPREKSYLERCLDAFERAYPELRVVRLRPAFVFQRPAAPEQRRIFAGPLVPGQLIRPEWLPVVPDVPGLRVQVVHADDVADAVRRALLRPVRGAFNLAAEPPIDARGLAAHLGKRTVRLPRSVARTMLAGAWHARALPVDPGLFDTVARLPLMDTGRARDQLGWVPRVTAWEAVGELLAGLHSGEGHATPPLHPD